MRAIIFANGEYRNPERPPIILESDLVIAADGGSRHCQALQIRPNVLIGDLDSSDPELAAAWQRAGVEIIRHPEDKNQTDLELALLTAQERGASEILVYGAVGGRLDMTYGNLTLLAHPELTVPTTLICDKEEVHLLRAGDSLVVEGHPGDILSLLPLEPEGSVVTAQGVSYPLDREQLEFGLTRGISNQIVSPTARIHSDQGLLAVIHTRTIFTEEI